MTLQKALFLETPVNGGSRIGAKSIPRPSRGEILVKLHTTGLNPLGWEIRALNFLVSKYPAILGLDAAGMVEAVGEGVITLAKGDRILTQGNLTDGAATYQQYIIVPAELAAKIDPIEHLFRRRRIRSYGFGHRSNGYLPRSSGSPPELREEGGKGPYSGQPIVMVGGSSSVGQHVIQLAKLSCFSPVITTASSYNKGHLLSLGATHVDDRFSSSIPAQITSALSNAPIKLIFDTVSDKDTQTLAWDLLSPGGQLVLVHAEQVDKEKYKDKATVAVQGIAHYPPERALSVNLLEKLPKLLEDGVIKPNQVEVLPGGLSGIPDGLEQLKEGKVSGKKIIVHPQETA